MKRKISVLALLASVTCIGAADANWERYPQYYDSGMRATITLRGGFAYGSSKLRNDLGSMTEEYWVSKLSGEAFSGGFVDICVDLGGCTYDMFYFLGTMNIGDLPAAKRYSEHSFAGGVSVGFTVPHSPQWRIEGDWLRISKANYEAFPMFSGKVDFPVLIDFGDGEQWFIETHEIKSSGVYSTLSSDIFSMMIYYDFFDGNVKPIRQIIPYVGFGFGYASSTTVLELTDLYGDLASQAALLPFAIYQGGPVPDFFTSTTATRTIAGNLAAGFSYGLMQELFLDFGVRVTYIPQIRWALNNSLAIDPSGEKNRSIFSANDMIYMSALIGLRFEF
jgi:hypothetical protein